MILLKALSRVFPKSKVKVIKSKTPADSMKPYVEQRPWGRFETYTRNQESTVKILYVNAGAQLSLQSHEHRDELWVALDDRVIAEVDGVRRTLKQGETVYVPRGTRHRLAAADIAVRVMEIALGHADENDITRYEDVYGRATEKPEKT